MVKELQRELMVMLGPDHINNISEQDLIKSLSQDSLCDSNVLIKS